MSGGSLNYAFRVVEDAASEIREWENDPHCSCTDRGLKPPDPACRFCNGKGKVPHPESRLRDLRLRFAEHLDLVAKALHDLEWVYSCEYCNGDEEKAIRTAIGDKP